MNKRKTATNEETLTSAVLLKSAYELAREDNIRKNKAMLQLLGLSGDNSLDPGQDERQEQARLERKRRKADKQRDNTENLPLRKSRRLQGLDAEGQPLTIKTNEPSKRTQAQIAKEQAKLEAYEAWRERKYERLIQRHIEEGLELPKNASYQHTVMRVKTMTKKRLATRVKVMERAQGAYAVIKMQQFAEVLILEGFDDIAELAEAALSRLLELPKFKGKDWAAMIAGDNKGKAKKRKKK